MVKLLENKVFNSFCKTVIASPPRPTIIPGLAEKTFTKTSFWLRSIKMSATEALTSFFSKNLRTAISCSKLLL
jgi:hypothetical protein